MRRSRALGWLLPFGLLCGLTLVFLAGCSGPYPQSTLSPKGDFATMVDAVFMKTVWLAGIVFLLVEGALLLAIIKFRGKPNDPEPKQIHGSTVVEIIWTIVPAVVLAIVAVPTVRAIFATAEVPTTSPDGQPPLKVEVIGHQWYWEFRYPDLGITTANELHVPLNRAIDFRLKSADVIHSFWVPQFAGKRDLFPNRETRIWMIARETGSFPSSCTEYCGLEHGRMDFYLMVDSAKSFDAWVQLRHSDSAVAANGTPFVPPATTTSAITPGTTPVVAAVAPGKNVKAPTPVVATTVAAVPAASGDPRVDAGAKLFQANCATCHSISSAHPQSPTNIGPNLAGIGTRKMIAAGWYPNNNADLQNWLQHYNDVKPGVFMAVRSLSDAEAQALVAYLRTRR
ncbi:MAG TPA: cytochrome c oxidase subunit II [Gemmatimonadales bacterium]|jgi:cytochrome c oxidase subunit 2|nr:cytochrome c oxidase subunit II [Gemmatimonadales bacterium]